MSDIELYAKNISDSQNGVNLFQSAIFIGSLLVGYFSSCKALLDACAITLSDVYNLDLTNKQKDFSNKIFWKKLEPIGISVYGRYTPLKQFFKEIINWRDSALHRITPLVIVHSPDDPDKTSIEKQSIKVASQIDTDISTAVNNPKKVEWVEPTYYHTKWQSMLINLCGEICLDIRSQTIQ
ncbi:MAG: hypothetical protein PHO26_02630 [Dehalococcoidia bacterium]|nr:hypothetical protein [Dehalococcoidia bacterium]MDD5493802.1 hypothetical protein [Dehalococcoidia bacterium]